MNNAVPNAPAEHSGIAMRRLYNQRLLGAPHPTPTDAVRWLGAVQAQDYQGAKWALALRSRAADDSTLERAFDAGLIVRTHVMRPTWHLVAPADLRWLLDLTCCPTTTSMWWFTATTGPPWTRVRHAP